MENTLLSKTKCSNIFMPYLQAGPRMFERCYLEVFFPLIMGNSFFLLQLILQLPSEHHFVGIILFLNDRNLQGQGRISTDG